MIRRPWYGGYNSNNDNDTEIKSTLTNANVLQEVHSKRKRTAPVWSSITEIQSEGGKGVYSSKCNFCGHIFLMGDGSTSNAVRHLSKKDSIEGKVKLVCRPGLPTIHGFHDFNLIILD